MPVEAVFRDQHRNAQWLARRVWCERRAWAHTHLENGESLPTVDSKTGRHTASAVALTDGGRLFEVSRVLVDAVMSITADRYGHRVPASQTDAVRRVAAVPGMDI